MKIGSSKNLNNKKKQKQKARHDPLRLKATPCTATIISSCLPCSRPKPAVPKVSGQSCKRATTLLPCVETIFPTNIGQIQHKTQFIHKTSLKSHPTSLSSQVLSKIRSLQTQNIHLYLSQSNVPSK